MAMTTLPKKAVIAPWMAFALALAMLAVTTGQPEMAVPLSTRLASAALARDADRQRELTSWRGEQAAELQKTDGWVALPGLARLEPGANPGGRGQDNKNPLPSPGPPHPRALGLGAQAPPRDP